MGLAVWCVDMHLRFFCKGQGLEVTLVQLGSLQGFLLVIVGTLGGGLELTYRVLFFCFDLLTMLCCLHRWLASWGNGGIDACWVSNVFS